MQVYAFYVNNITTWTDLFLFKVTVSTKVQIVQQRALSNTLLLLLKKFFIFFR